MAAKKDDTPEEAPAKSTPTLKPLTAKLATMVTVKEKHELTLVVPIGFHKALRDVEIVDADGKTKKAGERDMMAAMPLLLEAAAKAAKRVCHKVTVVKDNDKSQVRATAKLVTKAEKEALDAAD